ncbi:hypothetical protein CRI77_11820 [Mycolicibacterium duvalii]|uniref:Uncharacterized protein n=1 Tax=Mycolicibacterium duvalii TaxID=39688 RepID=A0A7I7K7Y3_9MYCO|nr:DUF4185 domain-containing protein [Mycolicibacterium duvalii]MCV7366335.1 DUF4185 domain-containing protein [Mycolicibacterium duvalii]PEG40993.1 hypothetical protein CRI77_11820 [Mycolicibacterium duvalii]BBX20163.1 hypothetical protein MDUV_50230 [Mycolicibacterium duvalii]
MGAAAYVGRVGGLAVALGVGSAVFAGHGVAAADDTDSSGSRSSSSATTGGSESTGSERTRRNERTTGERTSSTTDADQDGGADAELDIELPVDDTADEADEIVSDEPEARPERRRAAEATTSESTVTPPEKTRRTVDADVAATTPADDQTTEESADDPAVAPKEPTKVAVFASATELAEASTARFSPDLTETDLSTPDEQTETRRPSLVTAVVNVVHSMLDWARQRADADPASSPQPPFLWALMSFARRELENLFATRSTLSAVDKEARTTTTSLAPAAEDPSDAAVWVPPYSPWLNPQVSRSTNFVSWVTGKYVYSDRRMANTVARYGVYGTDVGVMWDNGMKDDPDTPYNESQVLIAVGDTFSGPNMQGGWRYNTLFRSADRVLSDGIDIPNGEWKNGNMFGGAPLSGEFYARPIINRPYWLPNSVTLIPTAGISVETPDTEFGVTQYVSFMSVSRWGSAGRWTTNYSAIAYSTDNGENFTIAPQSVRYNSIFSGNRNFQQSAFVKGDDGYVYMYGTPNGRQGAAYLARVAPEDILNASKYEYFKKESRGWFGTSPARWTSSSSSASAIIGKDGGACGATKPGNSVSEMSVQYNEYLGKYIVLYGDQFNNIVMRTSDTPEGQWSDVTVLMGQQSGGIYAPMLHPWSPSTNGTGSELYWNLSLWSDYNIMLMRTDLDKL